MLSLQRILGMVNLEIFIPNFSEISAPLRQLTHKDTIWAWYEQLASLHSKYFDAVHLGHPREEATVLRAKKHVLLAWHD